MDSIPVCSGKNYPQSYDEKQTTSSSVKQILHPNTSLYYTQGDFGSSVKTEGRYDLMRIQLGLRQVELARQRLLTVGYSNSISASQLDSIKTDPLLLSMLVAQQVMNVSSSNAKAVCEQLNRATDLQIFLRHQRVEAYQEQMSKAIAQGDLTSSLLFTNGIFDFLRSALDILVLLANPVIWLNPVEAISLVVAAVAGIVKGIAEIAYAFGANKECCETIISIAGVVQQFAEQVSSLVGISGPLLKVTRLLINFAEKLVSCGIDIQKASLGRDIEILVVAQRFNEIKDNSVQERKKNQERQVADYLQQSTSAINDATSTMENYGAVLAKIACNRA